MADITLTFADDKIGEIRRVFCAAYGWRSQEEHGTRAAFMRRKLREHIRQIVKGFRDAEAMAAYLAAAPVVDDIVGEDTAPISPG